MQGEVKKENSELVTSPSSIKNSNCSCINDLDYSLTNNASTCQDSQQQQQHHHQHYHHNSCRLVNQNILHNHCTSNLQMSRCNSSKCQQLNNSIPLTRCNQTDSFCGFNTNTNDSNLNQEQQFLCSSDNLYPSLHLKTENVQMQSQNNCKTINSSFGRYQVVLFVLFFLFFN